MCPWGRPGSRSRSRPRPARVSARTGGGKAARMKQLSGLDAAFLAMESRTVYGHVGSIIILDPASSGEQLTLSRLIAHIESRLHLLPPYRRRLVRVPFDLDQPYWV